MNSFNWKISASQEVPITSNRLWKIISSPSNLENFHPFCKKNPTLNWPGEKSVDEVHYYNGLILQRKIKKWIEKKGYDLEIGKVNGRKSTVIWRVIDKDNKVSLSINIYPWAYNENKKIISFLFFFLFIKPQLQKYINSVMKGLKYFTETDKPVTKNQFGSHRLFSN